MHVVFQRFACTTLLLRFFWAFIVSECTALCSFIIFHICSHTTFFFFCNNTVLASSSLTAASYSSTILASQFLNKCWTPSERLNCNGYSFQQVTLSSQLFSMYSLRFANTGSGCYTGAQCQSLSDCWKVKLKKEGME